MSAKTQRFQSSGSNLGDTIKQSMNMIMGRDVSNYTLLFIDGTDKKPPGSHENIYMPHITLGRDKSCHIKFAEKYSTVSRQHASISTQGSVQILNHNPQATNPTFVNGQPIQGPYQLKNGDEIQLSNGGPKMRYNGSQVKTSTIGLTSRIGGAVGQAVKPYRRALTILSVLLIASVAFGAYNMFQNKALGDELARSQNVIQEMQYSSNEIADEMKKLEQSGRRTNSRYKELASEKTRLQQEIEQLKNKPATVTQYVQSPSAVGSGNTYVRDQSIPAYVPSSNSNSSRNTSNADSRQANNSSSERTGDRYDVDKRETDVYSQDSKQDVDMGQFRAKDDAEDVPAIQNEIVDPSVLPKPDVLFLVGKRIEVSFQGKTRSIGVDDFYAFNTDSPTSEDRDGIIYGTGFMTSDGDLITARHVIQPWRYESFFSQYQMYKELNMLEANGADIEVVFDAFSLNGKEHAFNTKNMRFDDSKDRIIEGGGKEKLSFFKDFTKRRKDRIEVKMKVAKEAFSDWAKINFSNVSAEIKTSPPKSKKLKTGTVLHILGFSGGQKMQTTRRRVEPLYSDTKVAQDYTFDGIIQTSGLNAGPGVSGGPAMIYENGEFIAIGLITGAIGSTNAVIVPMQNIR
jgi:hypothetical protein